MADYGHDLTFGTFITPRNDRPGDVVALAQLTEQAGLDLATFQDHPYQSAFLDTWTLMSWVAAQTTTLRVSPNVLNLPLRQPAVLARAVASLDLLSGGRVELGLGAGAFWDAIVAMGGPRRTPGEGVTALSEAIDVIRGIWDTGQRGGVRVEGEHYRVRGAKRGPAPAHDVGLWLGAYKPRMLRLTGTKADGWLPSLSYLDVADLPDMNARIDEAAVAAERDPREIRRLLNVDPGQGVDELVDLALTHGFATFIVSADDPRAIQRFGEEVAPAVREAVAKERAAAGTATGPVRSPKALALRAEGLDYDAIPAELAADAVEPGDKAYASVRSTYVRRGAPALVLRPNDVAEVQSALTYARTQDVPPSVRSGGHGISGRSTNDGGIVIDLGRLDGIEVLDPATGRIRLGPAARWGTVARALQPHGLGMSSGDFGDVGVGGLGTTGGVGYLGRKHGLTIDHVTAAELVLADGTHVRADATENPDLLWAVRGAGGNFGIVTALELDAYPVGDVVHAALVFDASDPAALLQRFGAVLEGAPRELTSFLHLVGGRGTPVAHVMSVVATDDPQIAAESLQPLLEIGPLLDQQAQVAPYAAVLPTSGAVHVGRRDPALRSGLVEHLTPAVAAGMAEVLQSGEASMAQVRAVGGAINDVPADATAYAHRTQNFVIGAVGTTLDGLNARWDAAVHPHTSGLYLSFDTDTRPERLLDAFPAPTLERLRELKGVYDPDDVFDRNFPIPPALVAQPVA